MLMNLLETKIICSLVCAIYCTFSSARSPDIIWLRTYGDIGWDEAFSVQQTNNCGYIITGFTSRGTNLQEIWLLKTDSLGDTLWTKTFGGSSGDIGYGVKQTYDGGYIVVGETYSFGAGEGDVYLIKTDSIGDTLWTKTYGGDDHDTGSSVVQTYDGGYVIVGSTYSYGLGGINVYLIKTDSLGNTVWTNTYGGSMANFGQAIEQTLDGGYIITGLTSSFGAGDWDVYVIKTDSLGDTLWTRTFGGMESDHGCDVQQTADGSYIVAGWTESFGVEGSKIYLIKIDSAGNTIWEQTYGKSDGDVALSIQQTADCGCIVTGWATSPTDDYDVYLMKINRFGDTLWTKTFGGLNWDYCRTIQQSSDGGYVAAGMTRSFGVSSPDLFIIKTESDVDTLGTITSERSVFNMPNPFKGKTAIHYILPYRTKVHITIYNTLGVKIRTLLDDIELSGMHIVNWDGKNSKGDDLPAGIYFCCVETDVFSVTEKIVKLR